MTRIGVAFLCLCLLATASPARGAARPKDIPGRIDPAQAPRPDAATILLWHFDAPGARDAGRENNDGRLRGRARIDDGGRYGKCLVLAGAADGVFLQQAKALNLVAAKSGGFALSVDFWCRFDQKPDAPQCLFELAAFGEGACVRLDVLPDARLRLSGLHVDPTVSDAPLPVGRWFHLAVVPKLSYQANEIYLDDAGIEVLRDGFPFISVLTGDVNYRFPPRELANAFAVGNDLAFDAGFRGRIDEFQMSSVERRYYKLVQQDWPRPRDTTPAERTPTHFRDPASQILYAPFTRPADLKSLKPPAEPVVKSASTAPAGADDVEIGLEPKQGADLEIDRRLAADARARIKPVEWTPGVRGGAVTVRGGEATLRLPHTADLADGTIEFWFKPGNWDSLTAPLGRHSPFYYRGSRPHLLTLYGEPRDRQGEPRPLITARATRLDMKDFPVALQPHQWTHVLLVWGRNLQHYQPGFYVDGRHVGYDARVDLARKAKPEVWAKCRPAFITIGNPLETAFDEIRIYPYTFVPREGENARAQYMNRPMEELGAALCEFEYRLSVGRMIVTAQLMLKHPERVARADLTFEIPGTHKSAAASIAAFQNGFGKTELDVGELPAGDYPVRGALFDKAGAEVGTFKAVFTRKPLPWRHNRIGLVDTPPPPFEPVALRAGVVTAVGRRYTVGPDGNFSAIDVKGKQILAAPIRFELAAGGRTVPLAAAGRTAFGPTTPVQADWTATAAAGGVTVRGRVTFEYDGMARYEIEIRPDGAVTVDGLALRIPLKDEFGRLIHALPVDGNFRGYELARALPTGDGPLWDSRTWCAKRSITNRPLGNFVPVVWLGGPLRGLCWFADNDKGWAPSNDRAAATVTRENGAVVLTLNLIGERTVLDAPRRIVYGLIATPPKPLAADYRVWNRGNTKQVGHVGGRLMSCDSFAPWEVPARASHFDYWPKDYDWAFAKRASDRQRRSKHSKYADGKALMLYHDKRFVPGGRDSEYFAWEWNRGCSFPQTKVDCLVWYMNKWFGDNIMDGIYIDDVFPIADTNWETGTAYKLPDGRVQPGCANFAYRQYLKRMYAVFRTHGKPPIITTHMTSTLAPPLHSFVTFIYDCEDTGRFSDPNVTFIDAWPLDRLLTLDNAERTGLVTWCMLKDTYATRDRGKATWAHMVWRTYRSAAAIWLLFDMNVYQPPAELAPTWSRYFGKDVTVYPFWRNADVIKIRPLEVPVTDEKLLPMKRFWHNDEFRRAIGRDPLRATVLKKDRGALLIVVNFLHCPVKGTVTLDLDALGIPKDRQPAVAVKDADLWPEPAGPDLQKMKDPKIKDIHLDDGLDADVKLDLTDQKTPPALSLRDGALTLEVKGHNYRLIELTW